MNLASVTLDAESVNPLQSRLIRTEPVYLLEPEEVQKCMNSALSDQVMCLVLLNKTP